MSRQDAERTLQNQFWEAYYRSIDLILVNLIWFVFSLPLITAIPALGGLFYATNRMIHDGSAGWGTFVEGFRKHWWLSWRWGLINVAIFALLGISLSFYSQVSVPWLNQARWLFVAVIAVWGEIQLFAFPLLLEQTDQRFLTATRNSMVLFLRCPKIALSTLVLLVAIGAPSVLVFRPAWIIISASLSTYLLNRAVLNAIQTLDRR